MTTYDKIPSDLYLYVIESIKSGRKCFITKFCAIPDCMHLCSFESDYCEFHIRSRSNNGMFVNEFIRSKLI